MLKKIFTVALVPYAVWLIFAYEYHFIDGANLLFHEAGHLIFGFLGQWMHFLGGTLGQLFFPVATVFHFLIRGERYEAGVCGLWFAESLMYMAEYMGDARDQLLPLVGGHIHDWHWMFSRLGLVEECKWIAGFFHLTASVLIVAILVDLLRQSFLSEEAQGWD